MIRCLRPWVRSIECITRDLTCNLVLSDMRKDVQDIFKMTPREKQVMMFSATLAKEIRPVVKKFMHEVCPIEPSSSSAGSVLLNFWPGALYSRWRSTSMTRPS